MPEVEIDPPDDPIELPDDDELPRVTRSLLGALKPESSEGEVDVEDDYRQYLEDKYLS